MGAHGLDVVPEKAIHTCARLCRIGDTEDTPIVTGDEALPVKCLHEGGRVDEGDLAVGGSK